MEVKFVESIEKVDNLCIDFMIENNKWLDLKLSLLTYKFLKKDYIRYFKSSVKLILKWHNKEIIWYWSFLTWWPLLFLISKIAKIKADEIILWRHLYISENERWKWYAKFIKEKQIEYIRKKFPNKKYFFWFTSSSKNFRIYEKYWATFVKKIWNFYIYYYNINEK